ncbi:alkyl sulfatase dimerization domain-containing protein [Henriciella sp.]|uniref:alkyl/aryl-sulfatase n=1 Tax=Henriciella sp. TaxID=1968823 RepID=UPI002630B66A|nr:alkyl sulfatase dimerization domain-containing protein [Henriciella sp.]
MKTTSVLSTVFALVVCFSAGAQENGKPSDVPAAPPAGEATSATAEANASVAARLPLDDQSDFEDASRGFIAAIEADAITDADGNTVWSIPQFDFIAGEAPDTVNPSLWRQSMLAAKHGLFEVTDGIWQVRGYDLSVMTVIEGETGWIIVDPLTVKETAAAALKLVNDTLGERPVSAVLYTHSHADHFGGARGVISEEEMEARGVPVIAPEGFTENAVAENLLAGNLMQRRAVLMFGNTIPRSETANVGTGLGPGLPQGTTGLVLPSEEVGGWGTERVIDGVRFEFMDAGGTEAPAEFMFYLPDFKALSTSEVASGTFHNVLTPRGAKVRNALAWSRVIDRALSDYGGEAELVFASHHWPSWGGENVRTYLQNQRDVYRYVHDQTLRRANAGATMTEAAEGLPEPEFSKQDFSTRGYYGTLTHNAKAVYQYYYGWWSGVPANYHKRPHAETAPRYVEAMGGLEAVLRRGAAAYEGGDYRWAAELFNHAVFAAPESQPAKDWLAAAYEQMGFQAESGAWRSYYLTAAAELRDGLPETGAPNLGNADFLAAVPTLDLFDALASRYNPDKLSREPFSLVFDFTDTGETVHVAVGRDVVVPRLSGAGAGEAAAKLTLSRADFNRLILREAGVPQLIGSGALTIEGEAAAAGAFLGALDQPDFWFPVVTP